MTDSIDPPALELETTVPKPVAESPSVAAVASNAAFPQTPLLLLSIVVTLLGMLYRIFLIGIA
ncbi:MAG: hypothetical protein ACO3NK_11055, partial [Prochlorotrichaceae cyanobacterium]